MTSKTFRRKKKGVQEQQPKLPPIMKRSWGAVCMRKTVSTRARSSWKFENDYRVATASGPFKEAWERFHKGRLQANTRYSFNPEIVKMNMEYDIQNFSTNKEGRSRTTTKAPSYNEEKLIESQWQTAKSTA